MSNAPIYDADRGFRCWNSTDIWDGPGTGRYVPNVNDMILDWERGFYRVISVNSVTYYSLTEVWKDPKESTGVTAEDVLLGVDIGAPGESFRLYVDSSVTPHEVALDSRLHIYGTSAQSIKLFRGTDLGNNGEVISALYDNGGNFLGENIPLEIVSMPDQFNIGIKAPLSANTFSNLIDGEVVTAVVYSTQGTVSSYSKLLVKNTTFFRRIEANKKFITSIHLESPFLSEEENNLIRLPVNVPLDDIPMTGVVTYSDGSKLRLPANGGKFNLYGMNNFIATIVGQKIPIILTYTLGEDESDYGVGIGSNGHMSVYYQGVTSEFEDAYNIKMFTYPKWENGGYVLNFYLYTLDRNEIYNVTNKVQLSPGSPVFNPMAIGARQNMIYTINMKTVDPVKYFSYKHVQNISVTLEAFGNNTVFDKWTIHNSDYTSYGYGVKANLSVVNSSKYSLDISSGATGVEEWLTKLYYNTEPLINPGVEVRAPRPNMFIVHVGNSKYVKTLDQWNEVFNVDSSAAIYQGSTILISFIIRNQGTDMELAIAGLPVDII